MATKIAIEQAKIEAVKADMVKGQIKITLVLPLDDDTLELRSDLAFMAFSSMPVAVAITQLQEKMDFGPEPKSKALRDNTTVTLSGNGESVTLTGDQFKRVVNRVTGEIESDGDDNA
jgi:hypothetical protein